jgi:hypothetical protein
MSYRAPIVPASALLSRARAAYPCAARWRDMKGDDRVRSCHACGKQVFDLATMSHDEAEALLGREGAAPCVRMFVRRDGKVMTSDCFVGRDWLVARGLAVIAGPIVAIAVALVMMLMTAQGGHRHIGMMSHGDR